MTLSACKIKPFEPLKKLRFDVFDWDRVGSHDYHGRVVISRADIPMYLGRHNVAFELEADPSKSVKKNKNHVSPT